MVYKVLIPWNTNNQKDVPKELIDEFMEAASLMVEFSENSYSDHTIQLVLDKFG